MCWNSGSRNAWRPRSLGPRAPQRPVFRPSALPAMVLPAQPQDGVPDPQEHREARSLLRLAVRLGGPNRPSQRSWEPDIPRECSSRCQRRVRSRERCWERHRSIDSQSHLQGPAAERCISLFCGSTDARIPGSGAGGAPRVFDRLTQDLGQRLDERECPVVQGVDLLECLLKCERSVVLMDEAVPFVAEFEKGAN